MAAEVNDAAVNNPYPEILRVRFTAAAGMSCPVGISGSRLTMYPNLARGRKLRSTAGAPLRI